MFERGRMIAVSDLLSLAAVTSSCKSLPGGKDPNERSVTLQTKPKFKREGVGQPWAYNSFDASGPDGEDHSFVWPSEAPRPHRLSKNRTYTLDLLEQEQRSPTGDPENTIWSTELVRLLDGDKVLYDASVCEVHGGQMQREVVAISYGFFIFDRKDTEARARGFPNTGLVLGGCCVDSANPKTWTWVCPTCLAKEKEWLAKGGAGKSR